MGVFAKGQLAGKSPYPDQPIRREAGSYLVTAIPAPEAREISVDTVLGAITGHAFSLAQRDSGEEPK